MCNETTSPTNIQHIEKLRESVEKGGLYAQTSFIAYLAIMVYFFVSTSSTTHENILLMTAKPIPFLNIQIPFNLFFSLGPWAVLIVHLNQLIQYFYLSRNIHRLDIGIKSISTSSEILANERDLTSNFILTNIMLDKKLPPIFKFFLESSFWLLAIFLPQLILIFFIGYHLPSHNIIITWNQRVVFVIDVLISAYIWTNIKYPTNGISAETTLSRLKTYWKYLSRLKFQKNIALATLLFGIICMPYYNEPMSDFKYTLLGLGHSKTVNLETLSKSSQLIYATTGRRPQFPNAISTEASVFTNFVYFIFPFKENIYLKNQLLLKEKIPDNLSAQLLSSPDTYNKTLIKFSELQKLGLDLRDRDLARADFTNSIIPFALFNSAILTQANLTQANLTGSEFVDSTLDGIIAQDTIFSNTIISDCNGDRAVILVSKFDGALISNTKFANSLFDYSSFLSSTIFNSEFKNTSLRGTTFKSSSISYTKFWFTQAPEIVFLGNILYDTLLIGSNMENMELNLSFLIGCHICYNNLKNSSIAETIITEQITKHNNLTDAKISNCIISQNNYEASHDFINQIQTELNTTESSKIQTALDHNYSDNFQDTTSFLAKGICYAGRGEKISATCNKLYSDIHFCPANLEVIAA